MVAGPSIFISNGRLSIFARELVELSAAHNSQAIQGAATLLKRLQLRPDRAERAELRDSSFAGWLLRVGRNFRGLAFAARAELRESSFADRALWAELHRRAAEARFSASDLVGLRS